MEEFEFQESEITQDVWIHYFISVYNMKFLKLVLQKPQTDLK